MENGKMPKELRSIRLKKPYVETWPYGEQKKTPPGPKPGFEEAFVIILVMLPIQIVIGSIFVILKEFLF